MTGPRRGGVLLETLVALAVFVAVASFVLAASRGSLEAARLAAREARAVDLARSAISAIEAGLVPVSALGGGDRLLVAIGVDPEAGDDPLRGTWAVEVDTEPSGHSDLSLVTVTATWLPAGTDGPAAAGGSAGFDADDGVPIVSATLRGLVSLADIDRWAPEVDDLLEGLPEPAAGDGASS